MKEIIIALLLLSLLAEMHYSDSQIFTICNETQWKSPTCEKIKSERLEQ